LGHIGADPNANTTAAALREAFPTTPSLAQTDAIAFASERRWSAFAFGNPKDTHKPVGAWVLGAPDAGLDALRASRDRKAELPATPQPLAASGRRPMLLAHSMKPAPSAPAQHPWFGEQAPLPADLFPAVMLTFEEKVRDDARDTLDYFQQQGVE